MVNIFSYLIENLVQFFIKYIFYHRIPLSSFKYIFIIKKGLLSLKEGNSFNFLE